MSFINFLIESDQEDLKKTLARLPKTHAALVKKYKFTFEGGNTLSKSKEHVGEIDEKKKKITIASPWRYSREFVILHELAHAVYKYLVGKDLRAKWSELLKSTNKEMGDEPALDQNDEEIFAMTYATAYMAHPPKTYFNEKRVDFIKNLPN